MRVVLNFNLKTRELPFFTTCPWRSQNKGDPMSVAVTEECVNPILKLVMSGNSVKNYQAAHDTLAHGIRRSSESDVRPGHLVRAKCLQAFKDLVDSNKTNKVINVWGIRKGGKTSLLKQVCHDSVQ